MHGQEEFINRLEDSGGSQDLASLPVGPGVSALSGCSGMGHWWESHILLCSLVTAPSFLLHASSLAGAISEAFVSAVRCIFRSVGGRNGLEAKGMREALWFSLCLLWWCSSTEGGHAPSMSLLSRQRCLLPGMAHSACPHASLSLSPTQPGSWDCLL